MIYLYIRRRQADVRAVQGAVVCRQITCGESLESVRICCIISRSWYAGAVIEDLQVK